MKTKKKTEEPEVIRFYSPKRRHRVGVTGREPFYVQVGPNSHRQQRQPNDTIQFETAEGHGSYYETSDPMELASLREHIRRDGPDFCRELGPVPR